MSLQGLRYTEKKLHYKEGDVIFREQDENGNEMYFIDSGRVKIVKKVGDIEATLAILDENDFFGEMTLITGNKRSASAIAQTDCKLRTMDKEAFDHNLANDITFTKKILETLAHRLEQTDMNLKRHIQRISRLSKVFNATG